MSQHDAVIVATARTPIGRAFKGSLKEIRPDDLAAIAVKAALAKVPQVDPLEVEDLLMGCGQPAGESGYNIARVVALLSDMPNVPGVTVNRYCSSSLQYSSDFPQPPGSHCGAMLHQRCLSRRFL